MLEFIISWKKYNNSFFIKSVLEPLRSQSRWQKVLIKFDIVQLPTIFFYKPLVLHKLGLFIGLIFLENLSVDFVQDCSTRRQFFLVEIYSLFVVPYQLVLHLSLEIKHMSFLL